MRRLPFDQRIPRTIAVFGIFFVVLSLWLINRSINDMQKKETRPPFTVGSEQTYEERSGEGLRWNLQIRLEDRHLIAHLQDEGKPVTGVKGGVRIAAEGKNRELPLRESAAGEYTATIPSDLHGRVAARIVLSRKDASLVRGFLIGF